MENLYVFKSYGAKKQLIKEFLNKGWRLWGLNTHTRTSCKKLARQQDEAAALKAYRISLVFLLRSIHTWTKYYNKGIRHLFANSLSCNTTKYY